MTDPGTESRIDVPVIAAEAFGVLDTGRQIAPFSSCHPAFSLDDAYRVTAAVRRLRETRGETPVCRKIGLLCDGEVVDRGQASNVLVGPLSALRHLVELLARDAVNPPLAAAEIVRTGTLTRVPPVAPGETWMTALTGLALGDIAVRFT